MFPAYWPFNRSFSQRKDSTLAVGGIGEETGGNAHIISGEPTELILPHTKIKAEISTITYRIITDRNDGHGVIPDHALLPSTEDLLTGKDPIQSLAFKLIMNH